VWIQTDINKNEERYASELRIDEWMKGTDKSEQIELFGILAGQLENYEDPVVCIDNYKIIGVFTKDTFTKNPTETIELLNNVITNMAEVE